MKGFVPLSGRRLFLHTIFIFFILFLHVNLAQAKTVIIGNGSGFVSVPNMNGLNPGDVLAIQPGTYSGGAFNNLNGVTITNNSGTVVFTGQVTLVSLVECVFAGFQFINVQGISIRWDGNSRRCIERNIYFQDCTGSVNDAQDHNPYTGDTSSLKFYMCTFDSLTLFRSGMVLMGSWGDAAAKTCYMDSVVFTRIKVDSTLSNGTEVRGVFFHFDAHDWRVIYKGTNTVSGDVGIFYIVGSGTFHNIYRSGGRGYIIRIWNAGLKSVGNTYFYNNIDLNSVVYGTLDTRVDPTQFTEFVTGGNCYIYNNTSGNKGDNIGYWASLAVVGTYAPPYVCQVRNNLGFNLTTRGKPPITANQSSQTWISDSSNNLYFDTPDGVVDPTTCVPVPNSPVLGKGLTLPLVNDDYYHNPRTGAYDVGAVQHGGPAIPPPLNQPLVAVADPARTITLPVSNIQLDGTKSYDPDGSIVGYSWTLVTGTGVIASPGTGSTSVSGLTQGISIFKLTVTDNYNASSSVLDTIIVNPPGNLPPIANAGADQTITAPANSVNLNGTGSNDPDGNISSYSWVLISGQGAVTITNGNTASPSASGLTPGIYIFRLTVTDNSGAVSTDDVSITVMPTAVLPNQAPVANAGSNQVIAAPANSITLNGSNSFDPDGTIEYYGWTQVSGPSTATISNSNAITPTVNRLIVGTYVFQLLVTDNNGVSDSDQVTIQVNAAVNKINEAPVAWAGSDTTIYTPATLFILNASSSYDPDGNIASYQWQELSGPNEAIASPSSGSQIDVSDLQAGIYQFKVTVTDNQGATATATIKITVEKDPYSSDQLLVFPNPAHDVLNSRISSSITGTVRMVVYDISGRTVLNSESEKTTDLFEKPLNVSSLATGMYTIQVNIGNRKTLVTKFIKQ
jgi:hypothetical protein